MIDDETLETWKREAQDDPQALTDIACEAIPALLDEVKRLKALTGASTPDVERVADSIDWLSGNESDFSARIREAIDMLRAQGNTLAALREEYAMTLAGADADAFVIGNLNAELERLKVQPMDGAPRNEVEFWALLPLRYYENEDDPNAGPGFYDRNGDELDVADDYLIGWMHVKDEA